MMTVRTQPMLVLADVPAGSRWFQEVIGLTSGHGGSEYEMLMSDGEIVVQLHNRDVHEHAHLGDPTDASRGNGVLIGLAVPDFDDVLTCVERTGAEVLEGPLFNANALQREVWLAGPEASVLTDRHVVLSGPHSKRSVPLPISVADPRPPGPSTKPPPSDAP